MSPNWKLFGKNSISEKYKFDEYRSDRIENTCDFLIDCYVHSILYVESIPDKSKEAAHNVQVLQ